MKVLLPGTSDSVISESQTRLGAGLEQILSYCHITGWESLRDPQSSHQEIHGTVWSKEVAFVCVSHRGKAELLVRAMDGGGWVFIPKYKLLPLYPTFLCEAPASHPEQVTPFACLSFPRQGLAVILSTGEGEGAEWGV